MGEAGRELRQSWGLPILPRRSWGASFSWSCRPRERAAKKGETLVTVDSVKAVAEVYAPLSGEVQEANEKLKDNPEAINQEPYGEGWMVKLKIANPEELGMLLSPEDYEAFLAEEEAKG